MCNGFFFIIFFWYFLTSYLVTLNIPKIYKNLRYIAAYLYYTNNIACVSPGAREPSTIHFDVLYKSFNKRNPLVYKTSRIIKGYREYTFQSIIILKLSYTDISNERSKYEKRNEKHQYICQNELAEIYSVNFSRKKIYDNIALQIFLQSLHQYFEFSNVPIVFVAQISFRSSKDLHIQKLYLQDISSINTNLILLRNFATELQIFYVFWNIFL